MARVFFQKHSSTSVDSDGIYSVGEDVVEQIGQNSKTNCFASISRKGLTRETLAKTSYLHLVLTLRILIRCRAHASLRGMLTRELPVKPLQSSICLESSHSFTYNPYKLINIGYIRLNIITIKFGTE